MLYIYRRCSVLCIYNSFHRNEEDKVVSEHYQLNCIVRLMSSCITLCPFLRHHRCKEDRYAAWAAFGYPYILATNVEFSLVCAFPIVTLMSSRIASCLGPRLYRRRKEGRSAAWLAFNLLYTLNQNCVEIRAQINHLDDR